MENSLYIGLSKQVALRRNVDIVANNIANMNTSGYRGQNLMFKEHISDPRGARFENSQVSTIGQYDNTEAGTMQATESPLDVAVDGPAFLGVVTPDGVSYTRSGSFKMDATGQLQTQAGFPVSSAGGGPITIPANAKSISITEEGFISTENGVVAQLMVQEFENPQMLTPAGNGLYTSEDPGIPAVKSRLMQGLLEGSNVKPIIEMTKMIDSSRSYISVTKMVDQEHNRIRDMIKKLSNS